MLTEFAPLVWMVFAIGVTLAAPITAMRIRANASEFKVMLPVLIVVTATILAAMGASFLSSSLDQEIVPQQVVAEDSGQSL